MHNRPIINLRMQRITYFIPSGFSGRLILFADSSANENYALDVFVVNSR